MNALKLEMEPTGHPINSVDIAYSQEDNNLVTQCFTIFNISGHYKVIITKHVCKAVYRLGVFLCLLEKANAMHQT